MREQELLVSRRIRECRQYMNGSVDLYAEISLRHMPTQRQPKAFQKWELLTCPGPFEPYK